jgi:glyoxylase-like metal-dependent hydrolase (beta-lactamase superfamily II)
LAHLSENEIKRASKLIDADEYKFKLGNTDFELHFLGDGHFPNDAILWLPKQKVVFTGDIVFNDRLLGIQPYSKTKQWLETFNKVATMKPDFVVPGHGHAGSLAKAQQDTGDYLNWLVAEVSNAKEDWEDLDDMVKRLSVTRQFNHLKFHETWNPINLNRTYLQLEAE